jgi:hypothetical protein
VIRHLVSNVVNEVKEIKDDPVRDLVLAILAVFAAVGAAFIFVISIVGQ